MNGLLTDSNRPPEHISARVLPGEELSLRSTIGDMRRREALVTLGAVGMSGCVGDVRSALGLDNEDPPKPVKPTKPLQQYSCPKFQHFSFDAVERTICYRDNEDGPKGVTFTASKRHAHLAPDLIDFTMKRTDSGTGFYLTLEPLVVRLTDEGWKLVAPTDPEKYEADAITLRAEKSYTWTVGIGGEHPDKEANGDLLKLGSVGPGVYAFRVRGKLDPDVTEASQIDIAHAMLFTVHAVENIDLR